MRRFAYQFDPVCRGNIGMRRCAHLDHTRYVNGNAIFAFERIETIAGSLNQRQGLLEKR